MEFVKTIQDYIVQGELIKNKFPHIWNSEYDVLIERLKNISNIAILDEFNAQAKFRSLGISKFNTFGDYIKSIDINTSKIKFNSHHKVVQKKIICRHCGSAQITITKEGIYVCKKCGSEIVSKGNTQLLAKETIDTSKHIVKQLNTLTGRINPPNALNKILPYLETWFIKRKYIKDYLIYVNQLENWKKKYLFLSGEEITDSYFEEHIERKPESLCSYKIFKLYTDTFYEMTNLIKTYSLFSNNMSILNDDEILDICRSYYKEHKKLPDNNEIYTYKGVKYEIGKYIISKMFVDINSETKIKQDLNAIFNTNIKMPGLMFDYNKVYGSDNIPKKFTYQQNYIFIIHKIYNIEYYNILESDKQIICDIMMKFNAFVKDIKSKQSGKNHNSCLWQISLLYVFELPWFRCYKDIIKILPIKISNTTTGIGEMWTKFKIINHEYISKYTSSVRKTVTETKTKIKTIVNNEVDRQAVLDFINETGASYGGDKDKYLRDKLHIKEAEHDWTKNINTLIYDHQTTKKQVNKNDDSDENSDESSEDNSEDNSEDINIENNEDYEEDYCEKNTNNFDEDSDEDSDGDESDEDSEDNLDNDLYDDLSVNNQFTSNNLNQKLKSYDALSEDFENSESSVINDEDMLIKSSEDDSDEDMYNDYDYDDY